MTAEEKKKKSARGGSAGGGKKPTVKKKPVEKKKAVKKETAPKVEEVVIEEVIIAKPETQKKKREKGVKDDRPSYYGTGRRKEAVARVYLKPGKGQIIINNLPFEEYIRQRPFLKNQITQPLVATKTLASYDVYAIASGGGVVGQAGAVSLGIARALLVINLDHRKVLKPLGLLMRDPRMKERKKYGHKRARKSFQYTKR